jgi:hypothetical protein
VRVHNGHDVRRFDPGFDRFGRQLRFPSQPVRPMLIENQIRLRCEFRFLTKPLKHSFTC